MTRIDLLPPRYHRFRTLTRQVYWGLVGVAGLAIVLGSLQAGLQARAAAYGHQSEALRASARQYRTINLRFDELQRAERLLQDRKLKAEPLLARSLSILPGVQVFTHGLPSGTRLVSLSVGLDGKVAMEVQARNYQGISRFVKWVGETLRYQQVALAGVQRGEGQSVQFRLTALRPGGGDAQ